MRSPIWRFNPRPASRPGDTRRCATTARAQHSFQSAPGLTTGRYIFVTSMISSCCMFQSAPGLTTGRYRAIKLQSIALEKFQSAPGLTTGRYVRLRLSAGEWCNVSIRARPHDRAIHRTGRGSPHLQMFQSAPGLTTGRYGTLRRFPVRGHVSIRARPHDRAIL